MTNTINNVPRELLADLLGNDHDKRIMAERHLLAMLANATSPAGVDEDDEYMPDGIVQGIMQSEEVDAVALAAKSLKAAGVDGLNRYEVFPYLDDDVAELDICEADDGSFVKYDAAQAIIDGLRGENEALHAQVKVLHSDANSWQSGYDEGRRMGGKHCALTIDQHAQRIGELEGLLNRVKVSLSLDDTEWGYSAPEKYKLLADIRAALSAGKEGE